MEKSWFVYILRCGDGTLYTGITDDVQARFQAHASGKGAKYTRGRGPLELVYQQQAENHSAAAKLEWQIKQMPKAKKLELCASFSLCNTSACNHMMEEDERK